MPSAAIRRLQRFAFAHPLVDAGADLAPSSFLRLSGGIVVALSLNR